MSWLALLAIVSLSPTSFVAAPRAAAPGDDLALWQAWGRAYQDRHQPEKALDAFEVVLRQRPNHFETILAAGHASNAAGLHEQAQRLGRMAVELKPHAPEAHYLLGLTMVIRKQNAEAALFHLRQSAEHIPAARLEILRILLEQGRTQEAMAEARD